MSKQLPVNYRGLYARLLRRNPAAAQDLWNKWAREPMDLRKAEAERAGLALVERIQRKRELKKVGSLTLRRRV